MADVPMTHYLARCLRLQTQVEALRRENAFLSAQLRQARPLRPRVGVLRPVLQFLPADDFAERGMRL